MVMVVVMAFAMTFLIMVMMLMTVRTFFIIFIIVIIVVMFMVMFMFMMVVMFVIMFFFFFFVLFFMRISFNFLNPLGRKSHRVEVEVACMENLIEIHIAEVTFDDLGLWLYGLDDLAYSAQFLLANL